MFGSATFESAEALAANWEAQKKTEKSRNSVMDGIPPELPALLYALKVQKKAAASDYREPVAEFVAALDAGTLDATALGELLFGVVQVPVMIVLATILALLGRIEATQDEMSRIMKAVVQPRAEP